MTAGGEYGVTPTVGNAPMRMPSNRPVNSTTETGQRFQQEVEAHRPSNSRRAGRLGNRQRQPVTNDRPLEQSVHEDSLFVPLQHDDEDQWEPADNPQEEEATVGWDASGGDV